MNVNEMSDEGAKQTVDQICDGLKEFAHNNPDNAKTMLAAMIDGFLDDLTQDDFLALKAGKSGSAQREASWAKWTPPKIGANANASAYLLKTSPQRSASHAKIGAITVWRWETGRRRLSKQTSPRAIVRTVFTLR